MTVCHSLVNIDEQILGDPMEKEIFNCLDGNKLETFNDKI